MEDDRSIGHWHIATVVAGSATTEILVSLEENEGERGILGGLGFVLHPRTICPADVGQSTMYIVQEVQWSGPSTRVCERCDRTGPPKS